MIKQPPARPFTPSDRFWIDPVNYTERLTRKQLQHLLLNQPDPIIQGRLWRWKHKHLGVGVYELSVELPKG